MKEFFNYLIDKQITVATAESCTGGNIAAAFVAHPGISSVFLAGLVTYANSAKKHVLGVEDTILKRNGAVSAECAAAMLKGAIRVTGAQAAVCTTGIAGPGGGSADKPVGLVYIGVCYQDVCTIQRCVFCGSRAEIIEKAKNEALFLLKWKVQK